MFVLSKWLQIIKTIADKGKSAIKGSSTYPIFLPLIYNCSTKNRLTNIMCKIDDILTLTEHYLY
jgi:hypothetical protein